MFIPWTIITKYAFMIWRYYIAGKEGVRSVPNVRYYHKLFSDQDIPNW